MTEKTEAKKAEESVRDEGEVFLFPREGVAIKAKDREEAEKLYKQSLNKESDNG